MIHRSKGLSLELLLVEYETPNSTRNAMPTRRDNNSGIIYYSTFSLLTCFYFLLLLLKFKEINQFQVVRKDGRRKV